MPFLELILHCTKSDHPFIEAAFDELGALSVTFMDADAATPDERAILEPGVGEMPLWQELTLTALFDADANRDVLLQALEALLPDTDLATAIFREVADQDWVRAWMDDYPPLRFGASLWIVPWNCEIPDQASPQVPDDALADGKHREATIVRLDPGLAFGSGTHATTALCLEWLESLALAGKSVLDFGCGSGILAIAALKLGAKNAVGIDNDPQALLASRDNAERNGIEKGIEKGVRVKFHPETTAHESTHAECEIHSDPFFDGRAGSFAVFLPDDAPHAQYDIVVANILASALDEIADSVAARVKPGGLLALSGILDGQQEELLARYAPWFNQLRVTQREDWLRIDGVRK